MPRGIGVLDSPVEHPGDDLGIGVRVRVDAHERIDFVVVVHHERAVGPRGEIEVSRERERESAVDAVDPLESSVVCASNVDCCHIT